MGKQRHKCHTCWRHCCRAQAPCATSLQQLEKQERYGIIEPCASETGLAIKIFSFAVHTNGSQAQKEEHEAPITLYHVHLALASAGVALVALLESPGSFLLATARSKTHATPLGQSGLNLPVPETSAMSCVA